MKWAFFSFFILQTLNSNLALHVDMFVQQQLDPGFSPKEWDNLACLDIGFSAIFQDQGLLSDVSCKYKLEENQGIFVE